MPEPQNEFDYKKYLLLAFNRRFLIIFVALFVTFLAIMLGFVKTNKFRAESTVFIEESVMASLMKGVAVTTSMDAKIRVLATTMQSRTMLLGVLRELNLDLNARNDAELEELIEDVRRATNIRLRGRDLFIISFIHDEPLVARDFVNTLVRRYIEQNISAGRDDTYDAFRFLAEQIEIHRERLDAASNAIMEFRTRKGDLLNRDPGQLLQEVAMAEDRLQELALRRSELFSLAAQEQSLSFDEKGNPMHGRQARLDTLERRLEELLLRYGPDYPEVVRVKSEIQKLEHSMVEQPDTQPSPQPRPRATSIFNIQSQELRAQEERLRRVISNNLQLLQEIPLAQAEFAELEHRRTEQQKVLEQLMNRYGQAEVSRQMELQDKTTTFRIVDPAILPTKPVSPNRLLISIMGIFGGLAVGLGLALGLDFLDHSVRSVDKLRGLGLPVLAVVPHIPSPELLKRQRFRNLLLYLLAGFLCSILAGIILLEVFDIPILYNLVQQQLQRPEIAQAVGYLKQIYWRVF